MKRSLRLRPVGLAALAAGLFLCAAGALFGQDIILVGEDQPGCNHEIFFKALGEQLLPDGKFEIINTVLPNCYGPFFGPAPSLEAALQDLLTRAPTVVYFGFDIDPKPGPRDRLTKLMDAVTKRHLAMVPGGNPGQGGVGVDSVDSCNIAPAGTNPDRVGLQKDGVIDRTPAQARCIDLFVSINGGAQPVVLDGTTWYVAGTSTTSFFSAVEAVRLRRAGFSLGEIRAAFKLSGALISEDDLFNPRIGTLGLSQESRGRKVVSVVSGKVSGPATKVEVYRGVNCGPGAPLLGTVVPSGGSFRLETQAPLKNVCARVVASSSPPVVASLSH